MIPLRYRPHVSVGLTLLALLLLLLLLLVPLWTSWARNVEQVEQMEPRIARLAGLEQVQPQIQRAAAAARNELARISYPAEQQATQVGTAMQQVIRRVAGAAELNIVNSQTAAPRTHPEFEEIIVTVNAQGTLEALQKTLLAVQRETPRLFVGSVLVQPIGRAARARDQAATGQQVNAQISFSAAHLIP
jgi:general secretion pathway protein M